MKRKVLNVNRENNTNNAGTQGQLNTTTAQGVGIPIPTPPMAIPTPPMAVPTPPVMIPMTPPIMTPPIMAPPFMAPPIMAPPFMAPPMMMPVPPMMMPVPPVMMPIPPMMMPIPPVMMPVPPMMVPAVMPTQQQGSPTTSAENDRQQSSEVSENKTGINTLTESIQPVYIPGSSPNF